MNIFVTDSDPFKCAAYLDDKRVVKMIVETAQMLCTAIRVCNNKPQKLYVRNSDYSVSQKKREVYVHETDEIANETLNLKTLYLNTHINHPCSVWTRTSDRNYGWLYDHLLGLLDEYEARYDKRHSTERLLPYLIMYSDVIPLGDLTPHPNCTIYHKEVDDVNEAYRLFLQHKWDNDKYPPKWSNRMDINRIADTIQSANTCNT